MLKMTWKETKCLKKKKYLTENENNAAESRPESCNSSIPVLCFIPIYSGVLPDTRFLTLEIDSLKARDVPRYQQFFLITWENKLLLRGTQRGKCRNRLKRRYDGAENGNVFQVQTCFHQHLKTKAYQPFNKMQSIQKDLYGKCHNSLG